MRIPQELKPSDIEKRIFLYAVLLNVVARIQYITNLTYSIDCYGQRVNYSGFAHNMKQGRVGAALLDFALEKIGIYPTFSYPLATLCWIALACIAAILIGRLLGTNGNLTTGLIAAGLFTLSPYTMEFVSFHYAPLYNGLSMLLVALALYICRKGTWQFAASLIMLVFAISIFQLIFNLAAVIIVLALIFEIYRQAEGDGSVHPWEAARNSGALHGVSVLALGALIYMAGMKALGRLIEMSNRTSLVSASELKQKMLVHADILKRFFLQADQFVYLPLKALALAALVVSLVVFVRMMLRRGHPASRIVGYAALVLALMAVMVLSTRGILLIIDEELPQNRMMFTVGMVWAGIIALTHMYTSGMVRSLVAAGAVVLCFSFIAVDNHIATDNIRINRMDENFINRILGRMEAMPEFNSIEKVIVAKGRWNYLSRMERYAMDLNISVLSVHKAATAAFAEYSGYRFIIPDDSERQMAVDACEGKPAWPAEGSIVLRDKTAIVCFSDRFLSNTRSE